MFAGFEFCGLGGLIVLFGYGVICDDVIMRHTFFEYRRYYFIDYSFGFTGELLFLWFMVLTWCFGLRAVALCWCFAFDWFWLGV